MVLTAALEYSEWQLLLDACNAAALEAGQREEATLALRYRRLRDILRAKLREAHRAAQ